MLTNILLGLLFIAVAIVAFRVFMEKKAINKDEIKESFNAVAMEVLSKQREMGGSELEEKKKLIAQEMDSKKALIDQTLDSMNKELEKVKQLMTKVDSGSQSNTSAINQRLDRAAETIGKLNESVNKFNIILGSSQKRGEYGQKMAEDLFQLAGLKEGVNYLRQKKREDGKPDYTFMLPHNKTVNIDAKFPLDNYARYVESQNENEKKELAKKFLQAARKMFKDLTTRDYIDTNAGTVDYAVMFIPNEQIFSFINDNDHMFMDDAMKEKIIVCSPSTMYAMLLVIREAVDNFYMEKVTNQILEHMLELKMEWGKFTEVFDEVAESMENAEEKFNSLIKTRKKKLDTAFDEIEALKNTRQAPDETGDAADAMPDDIAGEKRNQIM